MNIREVLYRVAGKVAPSAQTEPDLYALNRCPRESEFLDYFEGRLSSRKRAQLENHFVSCEDCREFLALYAQLSEESTQFITPSLDPMSDEAIKDQTEKVLTLIKEDESDNRRQRQADKSSPGFFSTYARFATAAVAVLAVATTLYWFLKKPSQDDLAMQALALAIKNERRIEPRLSGRLAWSRYSNVRGEEDSDGLALRRAIEKLKQAENKTASGASRLALARAYLASGEQERTEQALTILRELAANGDRSAAVLNDTGVAVFQLGKYQEAVTIFTEALEKDPNYEEALFNRALASYRAQLNDEAKRDWIEFINKTSDQQWKEEARFYLAKLDRASLP
ncbi:MAG TPA: tetratricopeptide repeat protein [Blastocatellia bacterium]|nr:tetratricopeptide repeat protein [Blastocatellia bacterium]